MNGTLLEKVKQQQTDSEAESLLSDTPQYKAEKMEEIPFGTSCRVGVDVHYLDACKKLC